MTCSLRTRFASFFLLVSLLLAPFSFVSASLTEAEQKTLNDFLVGIELAEAFLDSAEAAELYSPEVLLEIRQQLIPIKNRAAMLQVLAEDGTTGQFIVHLDGLYVEAKVVTAEGERFGIYFIEDYSRTYTEEELFAWAIREAAIEFQLDAALLTRGAELVTEFTRMNLPEIVSDSDRLRIEIKGDIGPYRGTVTVRYPTTADSTAEVAAAGGAVEVYAYEYEKADHKVAGKSVTKQVEALRDHIINDFLAETDFVRADIEEFGTISIDRFSDWGEANYYVKHDDDRLYEHFGENSIITHVHIFAGNREGVYVVLYSDQGEVMRYSILEEDPNATQYGIPEKHQVSLEYSEHGAVLESATEHDVSTADIRETAHIMYDESIGDLFEMNGETGVDEILDFAFRNYSTYNVEEVNAWRSVGAEYIPSWLEEVAFRLNDVGDDRIYNDDLRPFVPPTNGSETCYATDDYEAEREIAYRLVEEYVEDWQLAAPAEEITTLFPMIVLYETDNMWWGGCYMSPYHYMPEIEKHL